MRKTAIFVEGWTEQTWVREYLLKWFGYEDVWVDCFTLFNEKGSHPSPYAHKPPTPQYHFRIFNVGGDTRVNKVLIEESVRMRNEGYHRIVGLRDMLSDEYRSLITQHKIDKAAIEKIKTIQLRVLNRLLNGQTTDVKLCYAIMETETWILGMSEFLELLDERLTHNFIHENLKINLDTIDPEAEIPNPATVLSRIFQLVNKDYRKRQGEMDALIAKFNRRDYEAFLESDKCQSFNQFHDAIHS
jgi:hypothetical protein